MKDETIALLAEMIVCGAARSAAQLGGRVVDHMQSAFDCRTDLDITPEDNAKLRVKLGEMGFSGF